MNVIPQHAIVKVLSYGENEYRDRIRKLMDQDPELIEGELLELESGAD